MLTVTFVSSLLQPARRLSIMGALRMVPGINVAQIDGNKRAVTARGFNGRYAAKL